MRYLKALVWAFVAAIAASVVWVLVLVVVGLAEMRASGSGGLGAVSAGLSEALIEVGGVVFVIVFVWRLRRTRRLAK